MHPGEPISVLDGVPIAIKDEIDCMPYPTTGKSIVLSSRCGNFDSWTDDWADMAYVLYLMPNGSN